MLSQEVHLRLADELGADRVGLLTGDQIVNPTAPVLCCTAEMAPTRAPFAVVDEAHWLRDADRGPAWTRLFTACRYDELALIAAAESETLLRSIHPSVGIVRHHRLGDISFCGAVTLDDLQPGDVVVAFSRAAVLSLARRIAEQGFRVGALYGSLPPAARFDQVRRFEHGDLEVIVATDAIGHGVNLPADAVVFAETNKFDGVRRRDLDLWELAQIAGRAGRGLDADGEVRVLAGVRGFDPDAPLVAAGVEVAAGLAPSGLCVDRLLVEPTLDDLDCDDPRLLSRALDDWERAAGEELRHHPWAAPASVRVRVEHLEVLRGAWGGRPWPVGAAAAFEIAAAPVPRDDDLLVLARTAAGERVDLGAEWRVDDLDSMPLAHLERIAGPSRALISSARRLGGLGGLDPVELERLGSAAELRARDLLAGEILENSFGRCRYCARQLEPRFEVCRRCRSSSGRTRTRAGRAGPSRPDGPARAVRQGAGGSSSGANRGVQQ